MARGSGSMHVVLLHNCIPKQPTVDTVAVGNLSMVYIHWCCPLSTVDFQLRSCKPRVAITMVTRGCTLVPLPQLPARSRQKIYTSYLIEHLCCTSHEHRIGAHPTDGDFLFISHLNWH